MQPVHVNPQILQIQLGKVFTLLFPFAVMFGQYLQQNSWEKGYTCCMLKNIFVGMLSFILYNLNLSQREDMEGLQSSAVSIQSFCFWRADKQAAPWKRTKKKKYEQYRARGRVWWLYLSAQKSETKKSSQVTVCSIAAAILGSRL